MNNETEKNILENYLLNNKLDLSDRKSPENILDNEKKMAEVAETWNTKKDAIRSVIQARAEEIRKKLIFSALPVEVMSLRQALLELAGILEDFENISEKYSEREKQLEESKKEDKSS